MMGLVYGGSTVNTAASGAIDGHSGCFLNPEECVGKIHFTVVTEDRGTAWDAASSIFHRSVAKSSLARRAWCLQERLLAA